MAALNPRLAELSDDDRQVLESWLVEFDQGWDEGLLANRLEQIPPGSSWRLPALAEMVKIDLERQWRCGRQVSLESYLEKFPELGSPGDVSVDLIEAEYEVRRQFGAPLTLKDYVRRFPHQAGELARLIAPGGSALSRHSTVAESAEASEPLPEQFGRYRIIKRLGQGGMGSVYLAQDTRLERPVALKVPDFGDHEDPEARRRFLEEARTAATLRHPYLCPVYDAGEIDGQLYLTMAYIEGQSLAALIGEEGWPQRQVAALVGKLALALQEAHTRRVVHRDLKPANVMIKTTGQRREPVIVDFGLARREKPQNQRLTRSGQIMGTLGYMAPEQIRGDLIEIGPACDIYALGVMLYELLTSRLPFNGSGLAIAGQILTQAPLPPSTHRSDLDPALEAICLKAMAKAVGDRYTSMAELAAVLTGFLQSLSASLTPTEPVSSPALPGPTSSKRPRPAESDSLVGQFLAQLADNRASPVPILTPEPVASGTPLPERRRPVRPTLVAAGSLGVIVLSVVVYVATGNGRIKNSAGDTSVLSGGAEELPAPAQLKKPSVPEVFTNQGSIKNSDEALRVPSVSQAEKQRSTSTKQVAEPSPWPEAPSLAGQVLPVEDWKKPSVPGLGSEAPKVGFQPLFNGKDLTGWKTHPKQQGNWRVEKEVLVGSGSSISHLYTQRGDFTDFYLRVEARIKRGGVSGGVFFRSGDGPQWPVKAPKFPQGYEAEINCTDKGPGKTGSLFVNPPGDVRVNVANAQHSPGAWFTMEVIARGNRIVIMVNEKITAEYFDDQRQFTSGHIALQQLNAHTVVEFRKIEIKELNSTAGGTGGLPSGPAQTVVGGPPSPTAAVPLKPAEKIWLQVNKRVHIDEFNNPRTGLPRDVNTPHDPRQGVSDGVFFVYSPGNWHAWNMRDIPSDGTCEVVARVVSENPGNAAAWIVLVLSRTSPRGFVIKVNGKGELFVEPNPWPGAADFSKIDPRIGPILHAAIKPGGEFNKLLLIMRKREVVIFVNGFQVCDPVGFDYDISPALLQFGAAGPGMKRAEFDRVEIREMMRPKDAPGR